MRYLTVSIATKKHVPTLGKGPFKNVKVREDIVHALRSMGFLVTVKREKASKKIEINSPVIKKEKEVPVTKPESVKPVETASEPTPVVEPVVSQPEAVEETHTEETHEVEEKTTTEVTGAGSYETTTGRTIEISEEDFDKLEGNDVTKNSVKEVLDAKGIKYRYKDTLATLLGKFLIVR